jgi:hypothetical protein
MPVLRRKRSISTLSRGSLLGLPGVGERLGMVGMGLKKGHSQGDGVGAVMTYQQITALVVIAVIFILSIFDIVMAYLSGGDATISWCIYQWSLKYPVIAFAFGFLMGHLFAQMYKTGD